jgi:hypothetical protein
MTTATAQAFANIAFIKFTLAKLGRTNCKVCLGGKLVLTDVIFAQATQVE